MIDLLGRRQALGDFLADRLLGDLGDEILDDLEVDVGLEQRKAHLLHALADIVLGQLAFATQLLKTDCSRSERLSNMYYLYVQHKKTANRSR